MKALSIALKLQQASATILSRRVCGQYWYRHLSTQQSPSETESAHAENELQFPPKPDYDWDYLADRGNIDEIQNNINCRKGVGDAKLVVSELHTMTHE